MYIVREIVQCKPGKVREMVKKIKGLSSIMERQGYKPLRLLTDVSGEPFWTVTSDAEVSSLDDFAAMQDKVMASAEAGQVMAGYHDLVVSGRREIFRVE